MLETLPGFREFYPEACLRRNYLFRKWQQAARRFGFQEYDIPTLEPLELFTEKSGEEIVNQLFHFTDQGGREVALRPELTPSLARMVGRKGNSLKRPVKWFNIAENFRYERQQKGRLRSHYQFNGDIFGEPGVGADAEILALCLETLRGFGLSPQMICARLSDRDLWITYLESLGHTGDAAMSILGVVDKMERMPREAVLEKLKPWFGDAREDFLANLEALVSVRDLETLNRFLIAQAPTGPLKERLEARLKVWGEFWELIEALGLQDYVRIDLGVVRGLAYYTGFVFEIFTLDDAGALTGRALAGGGRYDHLVGKLGYPEMPAVGFGMGDVTLADCLEEKKLLPPLIDVPDIYLVYGGESERKIALTDASLLRELDFRVVYPLKMAGFSKQFKLAGQSGARFALIYGGDEIAQGKIRIRDLRSGGETLEDRTGLGECIRRITAEGIDAE